MEIVRKTLRVVLISFLIIVAAAGAGMVGAFLPNRSERYMDKEIKIEQVDKNRNEEEDVDVQEENG